MDNEEFVWKDELVNEFLEFKKNWGSFSPVMDAFKKSKQQVHEKEKEYEILELISHGGDHRKLIDGLYRIFDDGVGFELDYLLKRNDTTIKKVRRISDNEVFSIGDKVVHQEDEDDAYSGVITKMQEMLSGWILVYFGATFSNNLSVLKKVKERKVLFTSEDGVPIYEGDVCYVLREDWNTHTFANVQRDAIKEGWLYFSNEVSRHRYMLWKRPLFSLSEILANSEYMHKGYHKFEELNFIKLAEKKVNL